jgi:ribosome maturation factor RimP
MYSEANGLHPLLAPAVKALGYELLGIERRQGKAGTLLRIYIDSDAGITVDDCGRVSHQISGILDVEDPIRGPYTLEVSSPGLDRPLFTKAHFERFKGAEVKMEISRPINGRRRLTCQLADVRGDEVVVLDGGLEHSIPFDEIVKARLAPKY